jgi:ferredoxin--NADP+ reductase/benzoate/toluate 1,2-dioxygenase reductase subunit
MVILVCLNFYASNINMEIKAGTQFKVLGIRLLTQSTYIMRFERNGMQFRAGQNLNIGLAGDTEKRDYSVYSGEVDDYLEILVKEVEQGLVSKKFKNLMPGDLLGVEGPFGFFTINEQDMLNRKFLFIASGTGIAPFHSITKSYPGMNYTLLHGVRFSEEAYEKDQYPEGRYISCVSKDKKGDFHGRVTDYLRQNPGDPDSLYYLCGNVNMIYDTFDILKEQVVPSENLHAEVYF